jgi:hypothetical protein
MWEHDTWGDSIRFLDWDKRTVYGFLPNRHILEVGDEMRQRMQSGKIARFQVTEIRYTPDPKDQFFATVKDVGYV